VPRPGVRRRVPLPRLGEDRAPLENARKPAAAEVPLKPIEVIRTHLIHGYDDDECRLLGRRDRQPARDEEEEENGEGAPGPLPAWWRAMREEAQRTHLSHAARNGPMKRM